MLALTLSLLGLSVFSGPLVSPYHLGALLVIGVGVLYAASANGRTAERSYMRRVALFLVILVNVFLITLSGNAHTQVVFGFTVARLANLMAVAGLVLWGVRVVQAKTFGFIRNPLDVAVLLMCAVTATGFLVLHLVLRLNGLATELPLDLLWAIMVSTLLHFVLGDLLRTETAVKRMLLVLLVPLAAAYLGTLSIWLAIIAMGLLTTGRAGRSGEQRWPAPRVGGG